MKKINVAITGFMATDNPYPGLAIARCLRMAKGFQGTITALAFDHLSNGLFAEDLLDHIFIVPFPADGESALLSRILAIHDKCPIDVLLPSLDSEIVLYASLAPTLEEHGIATLLPLLDAVKLRSKSFLYEAGLKRGIRTPKTFALGSPDEMEAKLGELSTPFLLKGAFTDARIASSLEEGRLHYDSLFKEWGYPILMQKFIYGDDYDVAALADRDSRVLGRVAMKKLGLTDKGTACAGVTVMEEKPLNLTAEIIKKLGWVGPLECEFVREKPTGEFFLVEINSRFPSWIYLAAAAGQNLPYQTVMAALGMKPEPFREVDTGKFFVRSIREQAVSLHRLMELTTLGEAHF